LRSAAEYLKVINRFRSVYYTYPASSKADESLMAVAELYQMMASDLKDSKYFYQAIKTYGFLEDEYPSSPYCPDAGFTSAEIHLNDLNDPKTAQPQLTLASDSSGGYFIRVQGTPNLSYRLQRAHSLVGPWTNSAPQTAPLVSGGAGD
jgi:TolA-binding protein